MINKILIKVSFGVAFAVLCICISCMDSANNMPFMIGAFASIGYLAFLGHRNGVFGK